MFGPLKLTQLVLENSDGDCCEDMLQMDDLRWNLWEQLVHSSSMAYRERLNGGWVVSGREREGLWLLQWSFMKGAASPTPSTSLLNHTSPLTEPLTSKESPHLLSLNLSPSFSLSPPLTLFFSVTSFVPPLALLPWQPWVKSQHVEKQRWGFWLCVSGKGRWGLHHYCVWGSSMMVFFFF